MDSLNGKVVIITGASEGIGARLAGLLRTSGGRLSLIARSAEKLAATAGAGDLVVPGDLTDSTIRHELIARTLERHGRIDVLINNAGRGSYYTACTTPMEEA